MHDPYFGYEAMHGEYPVPTGYSCYYEDATMCMYASEHDDGDIWCDKYHCKLHISLTKLAQCD